MCPNRFKIPITLLLTEKLFTADPNIGCLDGMFSQMTQQIQFLQRRIIFVVVYVCDDLQFALCLVHILENLHKFSSSSTSPCNNISVCVKCSGNGSFYSFTIYLCGRKTIGRHLDVIFQKNIARASSELKLPLKIMFPILVFPIFIHKENFDFFSIWNLIFLVHIKFLDHDY